MRETMRGLAQGIVAAHEARATGLASIQRDVSTHRERARRQVQELEGTRRNASHTLHGHLARVRPELARNEGRRKSEVRRWLTDVGSTTRTALKEATAKSRDEVQASLKEFTAGRKAMAGRLRDDLARGRAELASDVRQQTEELASGRKAMTGRLRNDLGRGRTELAGAVRQRTKELAAGRKAMARHLREDLAQGRAELASGVRQRTKDLTAGRKAMAGHLREDLASAVRQRTSEIRVWLRQVTSGRKAAAQQLREILARGRAELAPAAARRRSDVLNWLERIAADRLAAGQEWRQMATALRERPAGVTVVERPAPTPPREEAPEAEEPEVEEAAVAAKSEGITEGQAALRDRIFAYLADHPDGVLLTVIERQFGLGRLAASRAVRSLINEGKAKKQDRLYFAT